MANSIDVTLPLLKYIVNYITADLVLPSNIVVDFQGKSGGRIDVTMPLPTATSSFLTGGIGDIDFNLGWPDLQSSNGHLDVSLFGAGHLSVTLPLVETATNGVVGTVYHLNAVLPVVETLIGMTVPRSGSIDVDLPQMSMSSVWYQNIVGRISGAIPLAQMNASGVGGSVGSLDADLHLFTYDATMYQSGAGQIDVTFPILVVNKYGESSPATLSYKAIVMNTKNFSVSEYPNYTFNSMAIFKGKRFGATGNSIHLLGAQADSGEDIDITMDTGNLDFTNPVLMLPRDVWVTLRSGKTVRMSVLADEATDDDWYEYDSEDFLLNNRDTRVKLGRGLRGSSFKFRMQNTDGEELDIESVHIMSSPLQRRKS